MILKEAVKAMQKFDEEVMKEDVFKGDVERKVCFLRLKEGKKVLENVLKEELKCALSNSLSLSLSLSLPIILSPVLPYFLPSSSPHPDGVTSLGHVNKLLPGA